jgi:hypothetical protein
MHLLQQYTHNELLVPWMHWSEFGWCSCLVVITIPRNITEFILLTCHTLMGSQVTVLRYMQEYAGISQSLVSNKLQVDITRPQAATTSRYAMQEPQSGAFSLIAMRHKTHTSQLSHFRF